jgi:methylthioribose-1-phosphate isomerase
LDVLDQRLLPGNIVFNTYASSHEVSEAIRTMQVRGAPAIGIAAAYGVVLSAKARFAESPTAWKVLVQKDLEELAASRPTAVNLFWALDRMGGLMSEIASGDDPVPLLVAAANRIFEDDIAANLAMGAMGAEYLKGSKGVLTHCNTGSLATGGYGTALGVIRSAYAETRLEIFATETRPWSQGARLTVWELNQDRIPATLIADSSAAFLMKAGRVGWVIVGADRIAANGDTANKIGTYALAVAAKHHGLRVMVVAPTSTIDWATSDGSDIEIEERDPSELLTESFRQAESVITAWNPVFDVTPSNLIDVIVTERGVVENPTAASMQSLTA